MAGDSAIKTHELHVGVHTHSLLSSWTFGRRVTSESFRSYNLRLHPCFELQKHYVLCHTGIKYCVILCQGKFQLFLLRQQTFTSLHVTLFVLICTHSLLSLLIFLWCWQDRWKLREETYHHSLCSCDRFRLNLRKWKQRTVLWKRPRSWEDLLRWINTRGGFSWGLCSGEQEVQGTLVQWFFAPCHKTGWQKFNHLRPDAWMSHMKAFMSLDSWIERFAAQVSTQLAGVSCIAAWWKSLILTFTQWPPISVGSVDPNIYLPGDEASASTSLDSPRGTWWNQLSQKSWWCAHGTAYSGTGTPGVQGELKRFVQFLLVLLWWCLFFDTGESRTIDNESHQFVKVQSGRWGNLDGMTCWEECHSLRLLAEALCGFHDYKMYRSSPLVKKMHVTGIACQAGSMVQEDLKSKPKNLFNICWSWWLHQDLAYFLSTSWGQGPFIFSESAKKVMSFPFEFSFCLFIPLRVCAISFTSTSAVP